MIEDGGVLLKAKEYGETFIFLMGIPNIIIGVLHLAVNITSVVFALRLYTGKYYRKAIQYLYQKNVVNMTTLNLIMKDI